MTSPTHTSTASAERPRRRRLSAAERRVTILDAALEVFAAARLPLGLDRRDRRRRGDLQGAHLRALPVQAGAPRSAAGAPRAGAPQAAGAKRRAWPARRRAPAVGRRRLPALRRGAPRCVADAVPRGLRPGGRRGRAGRAGAGDRHGGRAHSRRAERPAVRRGRPGAGDRDARRAADAARSSRWPTGGPTAPTSRARSSWSA